MKGGMRVNHKCTLAGREKQENDRSSKQAGLFCRLLLKLSRDRSVKKKYSRPKTTGGPHGPETKT